MTHLLSFILLSSNLDLGAAVFMAVIVPLGAVVIFCVISIANNAKNTIQEGGIKALYPNIIKYIMTSYPNTQVTIDTPVYMRIESDDVDNDVVMQFSLRLNPDSKNMTVSGKIIPGTQKWAWIPSKDFEWKVECKYGYVHAESLVIEQIKEEMIFNPE